jgi:hypothetical protein
MVLLTLVFGYAGFALFAAASQHTQVPPAINGGIVVFTAERDVSVAAALSLDETQRALDGATRFQLEVRFTRRFSAFVMRPSALQCPPQIVRAPACAITRLPVPKPLHFAILFSGAMMPAFGSSEPTSYHVPSVECDLPQSQVALPLGCSSLYTLIKAEGTEANYDWHFGTAVELSVARFHERITDADGYTAAGSKAVLAGTTVAASRGIPAVLKISGVLVHDPEASRDGRAQGTLATVAPSFPTNAQFPHPATGAFLSEVYVAGQRKSSLAPFTITRVRDQLFPAQVTSNALTVTKDRFDRIDFTSPSARDAGSQIVWQGRPVTSVFTWQTSNDDRLSDVAGKSGQYGLLAGLALSVAAALLVALLQRAMDGTGLLAGTLKVVRGVGWVGAAAALVVGLVLALSSAEVTISGAAGTVSLVCPAPVEHFGSNAPISDTDPTSALAQALQRLCEDDRAQATEESVVLGVGAIVLLVALIATRRKGRRPGWLRRRLALG